MRAKLSRPGSFYSAWSAWAVTAVLFLAIGLLFRCELPVNDGTSVRKGQNLLLTLTAEKRDLTAWISIHDPSRIARGGGIPASARREVPPYFTLRELVLPLEASGLPEPESFGAAADSAGTDWGWTVSPGGGVAFPPLRVKTYPRVEFNGKEQMSFALPEELLKLAASVNAKTAEIVFSNGILPEERRWTVLCSSGSSRLDRELVRQFSGTAFHEMPARVRLIWDATGEDK